MCHASATFSDPVLPFVRCYVSASSFIVLAADRSHTGIRLPDGCFLPRLASCMGGSAGQSGAHTSLPGAHGICSDRCCIVRDCSRRSRCYCSSRSYSRGRHSNGCCSRCRGGHANRWCCSWSCCWLCCRFSRKFFSRRCSSHVVACTGSGSPSTRGERTSLPAPYHSPHVALPFRERLFRSAVTATRADRMSLMRNRRGSERGCVVSNIQFLVRIASTPSHSQPIISDALLKLITVLYIWRIVARYATPSYTSLFPSHSLTIGLLSSLCSSARQASSDLPHYFHRL
jgi:hypothetical protein